MKHTRRSFPLFASALMLLVTACHDSSSRKPNLIVITMDTTRADHLGCYGYKQIRTPNIDGLAARGVVFEEAFSAQPVTLPSHCSIMTGRYPFHHGVRDNNIYKLPQDEQTLAEILVDEGYLTTAFIGSFILSHEFGLDQGFHFYNDAFVRPKQKGQLPVDRRASEISFLANEWFDAVADEIATRPFFLWLHYYDPHADYDPPQPYRTAYSNPYDGEIAYLDDWLGYLFDSVKTHGHWDNTIIVLTADHGESLGEYGEMTHGLFIYRPTTHVPLILRFPHDREAGLRIVDRVSSVDIVPTILGYLGITRDVAFDGIDLNARIREGGTLQTRPVYSEVFIPRSFNWSELKGIREASNCYIRAPKPELYDIEGGRSEQGNRYDTDPGESGRLEGMLGGLLKTERQDAPETVAVSEEMEGKLQALGYLVGSTENLTPSKSGLPDPKDMVGAFQEYQQAQMFIARSEYEAAIEVLEKVVAKDPDNPRFLTDLANACIELALWDEAKRHVSRVLELNDQDVKARYLLGLCYLQEQDPVQAESQFRHIVGQNPNHYPSLFQLGILAISGSRWDEGFRVFSECLRLNPKDARVLNNLGYIEIKGRNRGVEGIALLRQAVETAPDDPDVLLSLGNALRQQGQFDDARKHLNHAIEVAPDRPDLKEEIRILDIETGSVR